jgi:hypothetical protein
MFYANPFFSLFYTQTMQINNSIAIFSLKTDALAGFELGSFVPESDAIPLRQGRTLSLHVHK